MPAPRPLPPASMGRTQATRAWSPLMPADLLKTVTALRCRPGVRRLLCLWIVLATPLTAAIAAGQPSTGALRTATQRLVIVLARERRELPPPLSLLDMPAPDDAVAGAKLAINDNNTTGRFLNQEFVLEVVQAASELLIAEDRAHPRLR